MAYLRSIKNRDVLNSDQYTDYLKDKTIFKTAQNTESNNIIFKNNNSCLKATNSYATKYSIAKGHNLVNTDCRFDVNSLTPAIIGNMNEANFISADMSNNVIITSPVNSYDNSRNTINPSDPIPPSEWSTYGLIAFTKYDGSGVLIDPSNIYINKEICGPLIYLNDPTGKPYYDLSANNGSTTDYIEMVRNNTQLTNFRLNQSINLKPYNFK